MSVTIATLLEAARKGGVMLWLSDGRLHYRLPGGHAEPDVLAEIRRRKDEVLRFLEASRDEPLKLPPLEPQRRPDHLPMSFSQERLWILTQLEAVGSAYNMGQSFRVHGPLDLVALETGLREIVRRHESLRTRFESTDGECRQVIDPPDGFRMALQDLSALAPAPRERRAREIVQLETDRHFSLAAEPLFRIVVLRIMPEEHVLILVMHHMISDILSIDVLVRELTSVYAAFCDGRSSPLPPMPLQYADFALWQRQWMQGETLERLLGYWKERLAGMQPNLRLPLDRPRPALRSYAGDAVRFRMAGASFAGLAGLARAHGASLYMVTLAVFQLLLSQLSAQRDITVGTPIAGRTHRQLEGVVGFFVNTLVMRTDLRGVHSFADLLDRVKRNALGAYVHQELPFEKLVAELQPKRDLSRQPLFQVVFAFESRSDNHLALSGLALRAEPSDRTTSKFDMMLTILESEQAVEGVMEYATDVFDRSTIEQYVEWYRRLCEQVAVHPHRPLSSLSLFAGSDRREALASSCGELRELPALGVIQMFERQVARHPEAVALESESERVSYRDLDHRSRQLARRLRDAGGGAEVIVGVHAARSVEQVVALLAVLKSGAAYLPVDVNLPEQRVRFLLAASGAKIVLTLPHLTGGLPRESVNLICIVGEEDGTACGNPPERIQTHPQQLASVVHVSGDDGLARGICTTYGGLLHQVMVHNDVAQADSPDVCYQSSPVVSTQAIADVLASLGRGGRLVLLNESHGDSIEAVLSVAQSRRVTCWSSDVSVAMRLMQDPELDARARLRFLRRWTLTGRAASTELLTWLAAELPHCAVREICGPAESGGAALVCQGLEDGSPSQQLGRPAANSRAYVLNENLEPVPCGMPGQLYVGGAGLARGYFGSAGTTSRHFLADPFGPPGTRMYATGDYVRRRADGQLEYLYRADRQLHLRGHRIEPGEIECALLMHPNVHEAAVVEEAPGRDELRLVAYYIPTGGVTPDGAALEEHLRQILPPHMVPHALLDVDRLPRLSDGTLDRRTLPDPVRAVDDSLYVEPSTVTERSLARMWADALSLERIGLHDDFFRLGGDSILAIRILAQVRTEFAVEVPLRALFETPVLQALATYVDARSGVQATEEGFEIGTLALA